MTRHFAKWVSKQKIPMGEVATVLAEVKDGLFEANLGGGIYKKRIRFQGRGKRGGGRTILCYKKDDRAVFVHGFSKNEKANLSPKELQAFKALAKILLGLNRAQMEVAIKNGDLIKVRP